MEKKNDEFPKIAAIPRRILAIPASNTSVERLFSLAKITVNDRRTKLGVEKIDKLMFLKKNLVLLKHMFDSKHISTSTCSKRKSDDIDEIDISIDTNESLVLKKHRHDADDQSDILTLTRPP